MSENLDQNMNSSELIVDSQIKDYLLTGGKWANFIGIVGIVFGSLMGLGGLLSLVAVAVAPQMIFIPIIYLLGATVGIMISIYLINFAKKTRIAVESSGQTFLEDGFKNLKAYFKVAGIALIVYLSIMILMFIFMGSMMASMGTMRTF